MLPATADPLSEMPPEKIPMGSLTVKPGPLIGKFGLPAVLTT